MNKTTLNFIFIGLAILAVGCQKGEGPKTPGKEATELLENNESDESTDEVKNLAVKLSYCNNEWRVLTKDVSDSEDSKIVAMGLVARECLKIESVSSLKEILVSYELSRKNFSVNWNELSKKIIKMESM